MKELSDVLSALRTAKEELNHAAIAIDGIAVIVNNDNPRTSLSSEQIRDIFTGDASTWGDAK